MGHQQHARILDRASEILQGTTLNVGHKDLRRILAAVPHRQRGRLHAVFKQEGRFADIGAVDWVTGQILNAYNTAPVTHGVLPWPRKVDRAKNTSTVTGRFQNTGKFKRSQQDKKSAPASIAQLQARQKPATVPTQTVQGPRGDR